MLDSYFFIPGDKQKFINNVDVLKADYFVFDLEESVSKSNKSIAATNVINLPKKSNYFLRLPFLEDCFSKDLNIELINRFQGKIVLPKVVNSDSIKELVELNNWSFDLKLLILIENPECFCNLPKILDAYHSSIMAVGFGTHDFCSVMRMKHSPEYLNFYRQQLILISKSFGKSYIDGVDTNLIDTNKFIEESIYAFNAGANGKFVIHPKQLEALLNLQLFSSDEIIKMREVLNKFSLINSKDIDVIKIDGEMYELPHLIKIQEILNKLDSQNQSRNI